MVTSRGIFLALVWHSLQVGSSAFVAPSCQIQTHSSGIDLHMDVTGGVTEQNRERPLKVVIVGGGWAGFSAADALLTSSRPIKVELLDASPRGRGGLASGWRTENLKRPVEAGLHGFWREYKNTFAAIDRIGLNADQILTPYTPSALVAESGPVAVAPVLGEKQGSEFPPKETSVGQFAPDKVLEGFANVLPPPLDVALLSDFEPTSPLSVLDRISALGLLRAWVDFGQEDKESWDKYDRISAEQLFLTAGVTPTLYRELVTPLLHVLPMTPGYDCSAAAALSCFHVFALQSKGAFDVRWCRGTIAECIFNPWAEKLLSSGNFAISGSSKVTAIDKLPEGGGFEITVNNEITLQADSVILAVGGTAMQRLLPSCPPIQEIPIAKTWGRLRGITCVAVRLFLRPSRTVTTGLKGGAYDSTYLPPHVANAMRESPVLVCGPRVGQIPELAEAGFCVYDLQRLHDEFAVGADEREPCAVLEVDFFRADKIANLQNDTEVTSLALRAVAAALRVEDLGSIDVLDSSVVRAKDAVSHFCVGSASCSPGSELADSLYICGDWIDRSGHASWSTEKAVVTGRQAAGRLSERFGLHCDADIIEAAEDTYYLAALRRAAKMFGSSNLL